MIQLSFQSYLRFIVLRAEAVFGNRHKTFQRAAESPMQVIPPASNSDKTILNSLQLWLNHCLVFKVTWDFFQNLSSPWFGGVFYCHEAAHYQKCFQKSYFFRNMSTEIKHALMVFTTQCETFKSFKSPLPPTPQNGTSSFI